MSSLLLVGNKKAKKVAQSEAMSGGKIADEVLQSESHLLKDSNLNPRITLKAPGKKADVSRKRRRTLEPSEMKNAANNLSTLVAAFNSSCKRTKKSASLNSSESSSSAVEEEEQSNFAIQTPDKICLRVDPRNKAKTMAYDELLQVQSAQAALSSHDEANNSVKQTINVLMKP